ncbi:MAG TPA: nitroreductase family protein [Candidatus Limnocylindrales bacterium]
MEFGDLVMKRRTYRRFTEEPVDRATLERIARLAQHTPSAGFSQGQRLVVVTDPALRREVGRICGEEPEFGPESFGPWVSTCAAQFVPCVSEEVYHRRYQEPDKVQEDGSEIAWPIPYWWMDVGCTVMVLMLAAHDAGLAAGFTGTDAGGFRALQELLRIPAEFHPVGVIPVGRPLRDMRSPSLKRGWVSFEEFARWDGWGG